MLNLFKQLKKNISLTLVEVLITMLILSTSAAGVVGSFSYGFKFIKRTAKKIEAVNLNRKVIEMYRAIEMANPNDTRLAMQTDTNITSQLIDSVILPSDFDGRVMLTISQWPGNAATKQISIKIYWLEP